MEDYQKEMCCKNCSYFVTTEPARTGGKCRVNGNIIPKKDVKKYRNCAVLNDYFYISCPLCGATVVMDWHCHRCGQHINYDIDEDGVRSNPHK